MNYLEDTTERVFRDRLGESEALLQLASTTFDPSVDQIFLALFNGYTVVVPDSDLWMDRTAFVSYCTENRVTNIFGTPSLLKLMNLRNIPSLRHVRVAGEKLTADAFARIQGNCTLANVCGPTETTVVCSYKTLTAFTNSVGGPIRNVAFLVVDLAGEQLVPVGAVGELWIAGAGVGRGYVKQPALTAQHFICDKWTGLGRVYRSGDLVRRLPDGEVAYVGRNDGQVKIRGFRVELGEVEARMLAHPSITDAIVTIKERDGAAELVAYYVSTGPLASSSIADHLSDTLPSYMLPSAFVRLLAIPLTPNGKLDLKALPLPELTTSSASPDQGSVSEVERVVASAWAEVLSVSHVDIHQDFFTLGGNSITALLVAEKLRSLSCHSVSVKDILTCKSVKALVRKCYAEGFQVSSPALVHSVARVSTERVEWMGRANSLQEGFLTQYLNREAGDDAYAVQALWTYHTPIVAKALETAWRWAYSQFPGLRLKFEWAQGPALQVVDRAAFCDLDWRYTDLSAQTESTQADWLLEFRQRDRAEYFDLAKGSLVRVHLINRGDKTSVLISNHHGVLDGCSSSILLSYVHEAYFRILEIGKPPEISQEHALAYFNAQECLERASTSLEANGVDALHEPDLSSLTDLPPHELDLNTFRETTLRPTILKPDMLGVLAANGLTLNTLLQLCWHRVLRAFLRMPTTVVGTTVSGRELDSPGIGTAVGLFINTLPLILSHTELSKLTVVEALTRTQTAILELSDKSAARILRTKSRSVRPFESLFIFENFPGMKQDWEKRFGRIDIEVFEKLDFPLMLTVREEPLSTVSITLLSSASFRESAVDTLVATFELVLSQLVLLLSDNPTALYSTVQLCSLPSLPHPPSTQSTVNSSLTLQARFKTAARLHPDSLAIVTPDTQLTYAELDRLSDKLAANLLGLGGHYFGRDRCVALVLGKSHWTVVGILGILKTGSAYVPLDPLHPQERRQRIIRDSSVQVIVHDSATVMDYDVGVALLDISALESTLTTIPVVGSASDLAYVIYTSGTSWEGPKGVLVEHQSVSHLLDAMAPLYFGEKTEREVVLQLANYAYDLSVLQIWLALTHGFTLLIPSQAMLQNPVDLVDFMVAHGVTHVSGTPSYLKLLNWAPVQTLKRLVMGGEMLTEAAWADVKACGSHFPVINEYGPTETTVTASFLEMTEFRHSIGRPIGDTLFYVLDENLNPLPAGVVGELCISGPLVSRGYLNRPDLNKLKFLQNPFRPSERLYCTGDLARTLPDGTFQLLGRNDGQIKVRGHRVEVNEVETAIRQLEGVNDVVVAARALRDGRDPVLVAWYTGEAAVTEQELHEALILRLPSHAVPSAFIKIPAIPLAITGKADIQALPSPVIQDRASTLPPSTHLQKTVARIWAQVLGHDSDVLNIDQEFFYLGGDSLLYIRLLAQLGQETGVRIRARDVYAEKTIRRLAMAVESGVRLEASVSALRDPDSLQSLRELPGFEPYEEVVGTGERVFLFPPGHGGSWSYTDNLVPLLAPHPVLLFNNVHEFVKETFSKVYPTQRGDLHATRVKSEDVHLFSAGVSFQTAGRLYSRSTVEFQPEGPYHLAGWSWGGVLAFEVARQLVADGHSVGSVSVIDSFFRLRHSLSPADGERMRATGEPSYFHDPPPAPLLSNTSFLLFKATQVMGYGEDEHGSDEALLEEHMCSYYVHQTQANHLDDLLPGDTSLEVIPFSANHFQWPQHKDVVFDIASRIRAVVNADN